jgi:hypothetical protein
VRIVIDHWPASTLPTCCGVSAAPPRIGLGATVTAMASPFGPSSEIAVGAPLRLA